MKPFAACAAFVGCFASACAFAHTPYLAPNDFSPQPGATVALDAAFAEIFFVPEVAFDNSRFNVTGPDGSTITLDKVDVQKLRTVAEFALPKRDGTWRFSTGPRLGAQFRTWEINGKRESARDPAQKIPDGAKLISHFQSLTLAEAYVSAGAPNQAALKPRGQGLELVPIDHPNDLYVGEKFSFRILFDGKPLAGQTVEVNEAVWTSDRTPLVNNVTTDAEGKASVPLKTAGTWLALARHRAPAPANAAAPEYSHSYTLTFNVLKP